MCLDACGNAFNTDEAVTGRPRKRGNENVDIKFTPGNCYGLIGANGSGKSTFLKILAGVIEANKGEVNITPGSGLALLKQNHFEIDQFEVLKTVIKGHKSLCDIMEKKEKLYYF